jgi:hypothetical protein
MRAMGPIRALTVGLLVVLAACNTPTIPLPPPEPEPEDVVVTLYEADPARLVFSAEPTSPDELLSIPPGAVVQIRDLDSGYGTIAPADAEGRFTSDPVTGAAGDVVEISFVDEDDEMSGVLCLIVVLGRQGPENVCP